VLFWSYGKTRPPIGNNNDLWIAAHAAALDVAMNNECEFRRIPGPSVENWAKYFRFPRYNRAEFHTSRIFPATPRRVTVQHVFPPHD